MSKRENRKKQRPQGSDEYGNVGLMSSMRGGFKNLAGSKKGPRTPMQKAWDIAFWVLIIGVLAFLFAKRFQ